MSLIHDDKFWTLTDEVVPPTVGLDEVGGNDDKRETVEDRLSHSACLFQARDGSGQYEFGIEVKFGFQLGLPLFRNLRRTQDCEPFHLSPVDQLADDVGLSNLTLAAPGSTGSIGASKNIVIDTVAPTVIEYDVIFGTSNLTYNLMGSTRFDLPWQITGIKVVFSEPISTADVHSLTGLTTTGLSGFGTDTLVWTISTITLGSFSTSVVNSGPDAVKDAAGNTLANPFNQNFKVLYGHKLILSGRLLNARAGQTITVDAQPYGRSAPVEVGTVKTDGSGQWSLAVRPTTQTAYQAGHQVLLCDPERLGGAV